MRSPAASACKLADTYVCLKLPFPPSANNLFPTNKKTGGRFPSEQYENWKIEAKVALYEQAPIPTIRGRVNVTYTFGRPDKRKRDVFNLEKVVSDFLKTQHVIEDDSLIQKGTVQWADDMVGCRVEIEAV